jgi:Tetratricopeptide repeat
LAEVSGLLHVPQGVPPLAHRASMTREHGAYALDLFRSAWWCHRCRAHVTSGPPAAIVSTVGYVDVDSFVARVDHASRQALAEPDAAPACETCGDRAALDHLDYHAYVSSHRSDMVARFRPSRPVELIWWSAEAGFRPAPIDDEVRRAFSRDALLRAARAAREAGEVEVGCEALQAAASAMPGEPELLDFLPWLVGQGKTSVGGAIADAHTKARPRDPEGWYWLAQIGIELVASGTWEKDMLPQIERHLNAALAIAPTHAQSLVAVANVARVRGDEAAAISTLERLLAMHPGHPEASYTLGLLWLPRDPLRALGCFEEGERAQPRDADYPRGRARALLAMGRYVEARAAAARARELAPDDPRVAELVARLAE